MTETKPNVITTPIDPGATEPGTMSPDDYPLTEREEIVLELVRVGIALRKAESLVGRFPADRIKRQLRWLPMRSPRRPASLLITAIENNYEAPAYANGK